MIRGEEQPPAESSIWFRASGHGSNLNGMIGIYYTSAAKTSDTVTTADDGRSTRQKWGHGMELYHVHNDISNISMIRC